MSRPGSQPVPPAALTALLSQNIASAVRASTQALAPQAMVVGGTRAVRQPMAVFQLLSPMTRWDWPDLLIGEISYQQWSLSDFVPFSTADSVPFVPSSSSFIQNYQTFLALIDANKFPVKPILQQALARSAVPSGDPASSTAPVGWAKGPDGSGILRWAPVYGASVTPTAWIAEVRGNARVAAAFSLPAETAGGNVVMVTDPSGGVNAPASSGAISAITIKADAWGQVFISPGSWFDASMISLGRKGPFVTPNAKRIIFGPNGLLKGRVSALVVAYNPALTLTLPPASNAVAALAPGQAKSISVGGFSFDVDAATSTLTPAAASADMTHVTVAPGVWIVGVNIETFA